MHLQGTFLGQGLDPHLLYWQEGSLSLSRLLDATAQSLHHFLRLRTVERPSRGAAGPVLLLWGWGGEGETEGEGERPTHPYLRGRYLLSIWLDLYSPSICYQDNTIIVL